MHVLHFRQPLAMGFLVCHVSTAFLGAISCGVFHLQCGYCIFTTHSKLHFPSQRGYHI